MFTRKARKDGNHTEIVEYFRKNGCSVLDIAQLKNCCDIFVSKNGQTVAIEIKDGSRCKSQRKMSDGELTFRDNWQGLYKLVESIDDANEVLKMLE